jgi:ribosomal protein S18 acetylase RimI-like enzyme
MGNGQLAISKSNELESMSLTLREDAEPDIEFYYRQQFEIYHEPYLLWDRDTWEEILSVCAVYRIEVDGECVGDIIWEDRRKAVKYVVDFSILPGYQGRGIGKSVLEEVKKTSRRIAAITQKETLGFFLKSGFVVKRRLRNYYHPHVDGYYILYQ